jgi:hypothetical protein
MSGHNAGTDTSLTEPELAQWHSQGSLSVKSYCGKTAKLQLLRYFLTVDMVMSFSTRRGFVHGDQVKLKAAIGKLVGLRSEDAQVVARRDKYFVLFTSI